MEDTNKDHIFTEIYIGIHCMMVLMVLIYYVYSQKTESIMTLILLDIDDFKVVNDVYGHLSGDYVIREVSQIIKSSSAPPILEPATGGENSQCYCRESVNLLVKELPNAFATAVAEYPFEFDHQQMRITLSAGVCHSTVTLNRGEQTMLVDQADQLLYHSKKNGKNRVTSARFK